MPRLNFEVTISSLFGVDSLQYINASYFANRYINTTAKEEVCVSTKDYYRLFLFVTLDVIVANISLF